MGSWHSYQGLCSLSRLNSDTRLNVTVRSSPLSISSKSLFTMPPRLSKKDYKRVQPEDTDATKPAADNEIRVIAARGQRNYISYAIAALTGAEGKTKHEKIIITGMGAAVYNAVNIAEVVKRRVAGLHQITEIASQTVKDTYEPVAEGKDNITVERKVSTISITLSTKALDTNHYGYQAPLPADQVVEQEERPARPERTRRPKGEGKSDDDAAADGAKPAGEKAEGEGRARRTRGGRRGRGAGGEKTEGGAAPAANAAAAAPAKEGGRGGRREGARGSPKTEGSPKADGATAAAPARGGRGAAAGGSPKGDSAAPTRGGRGAGSPASSASPRGGRGAAAATGSPKDSASPRGGRGGGSPAGAAASGSPRGGRGAGSPAGAAASGSPRGGRGAGSPAGAASSGSPRGGRGAGSPAGAAASGSPRGGRGGGRTERGGYTS
jgi:ribonuclease P/MRP protein subunit RPP25